MFSCNSEQTGRHCWLQVLVDDMKALKHNVVYILYCYIYNLPYCPSLILEICMVV